MKKKWKTPRRTEHQQGILVDGKIDLSTGTTLLLGDVDDEMLQLVYKSLMLFEGKDCRFVINSGGGDIVSGLAICDLITAYPGEVVMDVCGEAESMGAIILQAADLRRIHKSAHLMLHEGEDSPPEGLKNNIKAYLKLVDKLDHMCDEIVLRRIQQRHPKYSWNQFRRETSLDVYFLADDAKKWGLVDVII